ncbi:PstS family phosphate ABC transporter substrate-binding protein [Virgibacillus alimentarius]|uniref:Phosphate-binding protein n=1 Tax=Virgibacillus alimentarius TaxID=698769 RepID=A0ABS4S7U1_9BACI|nr:MULTISPECIES: PstS family phosphate ABC transporter substrate-binding protein [Virgibacillus]MBP2257561.1 phosphate transport system substrate-binding protein [Virgibacillus alimentarius]HLR68911.1 PstS family phosphate ABC transporter substrate-binding protein [Virgibacillus sp.]
MNFKKYFVFFVLISFAMILTACGNDSKDEEGNKAKGKESNELEGSVAIDGSGTVYPLMSKLAEEYMVNEQENVSVEVSRAGTSAGFKKFLAEDGTDFNDASRQIKDEEAKKAEELGMEVKELKVALDGLTFVVHPDNDWATELTEKDLKKIFLKDENIEKWSDIDPEFPDEKINTYGPNENHGTYEFFYENILEEKDLVSDINLQQEYSTLVNLISEDVNGIAFFGFGYYVNNQDKLQAVHVDFGDGPVEPSIDTIAEDGDYAPFTRPVFTYLNVDQAKEKPQVLDYAIYVMNHVNEFAGETGFAPLPEEEVQEYVDFLEGLKE